MNLAVVVDKIQAYSKTLKEHGFVRSGDGIKPWSLRSSKGNLHIDVRGCDWTAYEGETELCSNKDPETLAMYLNGDHKTGACI